MSLVTSLVRTLSLVLFGGAVALSQGCVVEHDHPYYGPTEIQFDEVRNLGATCASVTGWTVTNRETGNSGTAGCEQPVIFTNLAPNTSYTFDITGSNGSRVCWQGSCAVTTVPGEIAYADCSAEIQHLCGL
jgi:hypothetical protein